MLSKTALSAVKAFSILAGLPEGERLGAAAIAERIDAGANYLGKLLQALAREGLVESQKGLGGGFRLARSASTISLYDVVEPVDRVSRWDGCFMGRSECSRESPCAVHDRWAAVREAYLTFLKETTISDLTQRKGLSVSIPR